MADYIKITRKKDKLREKLNALVPGINEAINEANEKSAKELAEAIRTRAPVSAGAPSKGAYGHYRDSIVAKPVDDNAERLDEGIQTSFTSKVSRGKNKGATRKIVARARDTLAWGIFAHYYWRFLEFGTSKMPARPHINPTYRSMKKRFRSRLSRSVNKKIKQVTK